MQLTNVSAGKAGEAQAKPETFQNYPIKDGKVQGSFYQFASTIKKVQVDYDAQKPTNRAGEEVVLWKRPFVFLSTAASNLGNMIANAFKAVFFCFFKAEEIQDGEKAGAKKGVPSAADNE